MVFVENQFKQLNKNGKVFHAFMVTKKVSLLKIIAKVHPKIIQSIYPINAKIHINFSRAVGELVKN